MKKRTFLATVAAATIAASGSFAADKVKAGFIFVGPVGDGRGEDDSGSVGRKGRPTDDGLADGEAVVAAFAVGDHQLIEEAVVALHGDEGEVILGIVGLSGSRGNRDEDGQYHPSDQALPDPHWMPRG